jgi:hypothetical protein
MKVVEEYCWTVGTKKLEILTDQFLLQSLLRRARKMWADLKRKYKKFFEDWQMCYLNTYCKNCREYHLCPDDLGIPRWKFLNKK